MLPTPALSFEVALNHGTTTEMIFSLPSTSGVVAQGYFVLGGVQLKDVCLHFAHIYICLNNLT